MKLRRYSRLLAGDIQAVIGKEILLIDPGDALIKLGVPEGINHRRGTAKIL